MRVLHFSTEVNGGAAIAARRIHEQLLHEGVESHFFHRLDPSPSVHYHRMPPWNRRIPIVTPASLLRRSLRYLWRRVEVSPRRTEFFSSPRMAFSTPAPVLSSLEVSRETIYHLHWVSGLLDLPSFFASLPLNPRVVWTLHDMEPMTGGCHYSNACSGFTEACRACPQLANRFPWDSAELFRMTKQRLFERYPVHLVADSHWLEAQARRSRTLRLAQSFRTIHYGIDTEIFRPVAKAEARKNLGLPATSFTVAFGAARVDLPRKGIAELHQALLRLNRKNLQLLTFGAGTPLFGEDWPLHHFGYVQEEETLRQIYSAADVFVIPSLQEAFGQTSLESLACGTPVVGFDTGGIPDMVVDGVTGLLAKSGDSADLAKKLQWLRDNPQKRKAYGISARESVLTHFMAQRQAHDYVALYNSLLGGAETELRT